MKLHNIYITAVALLSMTAMTGCNDFLDVRPAGEKVEGDLFETPKGFEEAIYGVYGSMAHTPLYGMDLLWGLTDIMAQDLNCMSTAGEPLSKYDYDNENVRSRFSSVWTAAYETIGYANNVIKNLEGREDIPYADIYRGEMLGVRALLHFDMLRIFASTDRSKTGIPYVKTWDFSVKPFQTVGDNLKNIIADLKEAESLLASNDEAIMTYPHDNNQYDKFMNWRETHMNVWAVRGLLARVYFYMGEKAQAASYATQVIDSGVFPLVDITEVKDYLAGSLSPKETIFGIYANKYLDTARTYLYSSQSFFSYDPYSDNAYYSWQDLYDEDINSTSQDFRKNHFLIGAPTRCIKVVDYKGASASGEITNPSCIPGVTVMHVSELYLIAAEALLESDYDRALGYFNDEIASRGLTRLGDSETLDAERIYHEFHKELYCEGQNWFNMKRLNRNIESNAERRIIAAGDDIYVVPVPAGEYEYRN